MTRRRTIFPGLAAAATLLAAGASPAVPDRGGSATGEVWRSPVTGRAWRAFADPDGGAKWFEDDGGRRVETCADVVRAEESSLPRAERVVHPALREAAADAPHAPVDVILRFARQPVADAADEVRARRGPDAAAAIGRVRSVLALLAERRSVVGAAPDPSADETTFLSDDERRELRAARAAVRDTVRTIRREILEIARPAVAAQHAPVVRRIEAAGGRVLGRGVALSFVAARVAASDVAELARDLPDVVRISPSGRRRVSLDVAVPTTGAGTWWSAGFDGSSSTKVAVLDTGVDSSHPAFTGGVVSDEAVFLSAGATDSAFDDDDASTDDFHFHGTHCAGIVASGDSSKKGVAPGARVMNAKCGYNTTDGGGSLQDPDIAEAGDWAASNGADVLSCSFGGDGTTDGSSDLTLFFDAIVSDLGIAVAVAAGNSGSGAGTVGIPGDGFNVVTVGNFDDHNTTSRSDDSIAGSSSRGPLDDGRRKPDLSAPGTSISSTYAFWESSGDFVSATGTSMACPHTAGALALLADAAVATTPAGAKALLLTNVRNTSPVPTSPGNDWGWGALDLTAAYTNRAAVAESSLTSSGARTAWFRPGTLSSGRRVTLVWDRRVVSDGTTAPSAYSTLLDLDLAVYEESDGSTRGSSSSSLDPVEQVALTSSSSAPVVKVRRAASSFPSGLSTQSFAVAAETTGALTEVAPPALACSFTTAPTTVGGSSDVTVTVTVTNSGDLAAIAPSLTLSLPTGYSVVSGANPATLSRIAASGTASATWTVRTGTGPTGTKTLSAAASSSSYGETFTSASASSSHLLDVTPPSGSVTVASGAAWTASPTVSVALSASDADSGVVSMRVREAGTTWGAWTGYATTASVTFTGGDGTRTVEAEFRDAVGNVSSTVSDAIGLDTTAPSGTIVVAGGDAWTSSLSVSAALAATDATSGVAEMRFSDDGATWTSWTPYAATASRTLPAGDGAKSVHVQFRDTAGNVSASASDGIGLDTVAPTVSLVLSGGAAWTASSAVTAATTASDAASGVASMRFSEDGGAWSAWETYAASSQRTLAGADGTRTLRVQVRDAAGNVSSDASDSIGLDTTAPTGALVVQSGASWTTTASVSLGLSSSDASSGVAEMRFSDDGTTWSAWAAAGATAAWTLPGADGTKTVHAQVRDVAGNVSAAFTDAIGLDRAAPSGTISIAAGADWTSGADVALGLACSDATSGPAEMRFSDDGTTWSAWAPYSASSAWTLVAGDGLRSVFAQFRDVAGNVSADVSDTIGVDATAPTVDVSIDGGAAWTSSASVTLGVTPSDSGSGASEMRFSDDGATWSAWVSVASSTAWTLPGADGTKTVFAQVRDIAGNVSASGSDAVGLDRGAPSGSVTLAGGAVAVRDAIVAMSLAWSDPLSGVTSMRFSSDGATWSSWETATAARAWTLAEGDGVRGVRAQFRDAAGNVSPVVSDDVLADRTAPTGAIVVAGGASYLPPGAPLSVETDTADGDGSGVAESRWSLDGGATWTEWAPHVADSELPLPEGPRDDVITVAAQFRDVAGNESAPATGTVRLLAASPADATSAKTLTGSLAPGGDHDAFRIDLVAGDRVDLRAKLRPPVRGADVAAAIDVFDPMGVRVIYDSAGVRGLVVATTGAWTIVLHAAGAAADAGADYSIAVKVRTARSAPVAGTGDAPVAITFAGSPSRRVSGRITGAASTAASLVGPSGTIPVTLTGTGRRRIVPPTLLSVGAGACSLLVTTEPSAPTELSWRLVLTPVPRKSVVAE